jgi:hypothetical protein
MRYRKLGNSDLAVSEISLGSWLTFAGGVAAEQTRACTEAAFDAGINFFDTANAYGQGAAESAWGEILSKHPRDSYVLATKVFGQMSATDQGLPAGRAAGQGPLPRLQRVDSRADPGGHRYRRARPVRFLSAPVLHALAGSRGRGVPAVLGQRHLPDRLVAAGPGRAHRQVQARAAAPGRQPLRQRRDELRAGPRVQRRRGEVASAITGASRPEQVHANAQASGVQLTADVLAAIDAALGTAPVKAPTLAPLAQEGILHR